ncbi:MAG: flagellar motor protein MotA [Alphaproteobacteria bacterium]|nr:flagellar motor protein MotA [Alphaproteobacteria bacterium]
MTRPTPYLLRMLAFLAIVLAVAALLSPALSTAYAHNPMLNSLILAILLAGIAWNLRQVGRLAREVNWVEGFQRGRARATPAAAPRLLAPMANMLAARASRARDGSERFTLSAPAMRSLLDGIASRLDEGRELSRYMTGLLIFLGLLGTFWGLLLTVGAVGDVVGSMSVGSGDLNTLFEQLKSGLQRPLHGMGTAFSSSMFGLAGALVLGFLDLTAGQAQNRFYNELEEWLSGLTRLSSGVLGGEGDTPVPVYVQALLEQTAENMENLQHILSRGEEGRVQANQAVMALTERIATLSDSMRTHQQLMLRIAEAQAAIAPALQRLTEGRDGVDDVARGHLRNIELYMQRLLTESEQGRVQSTAELRNDIRVLTRTIAALAEEQPH